MSATERYRLHHIELDALFDRVHHSLHNTAGESWARDLTRLLAEFTSRLSTHLSVEDHTLYPTLLAAGDRNLATMATRYQNEMGDLYKSYMEFWQRWRTSGALHREIDRFLPEARQIFARLRARIEREDRELYPLADQVLG
ncbi:MAG TPA: hemerythrin domain-containing protein [Ferrovibrio sp.]|uniref:hemerythrin domain-containing protein n=1 Tax=Ferrovibrio sp. TaxID=1917215 RepID=UPI002ED21A23